MTLSVRLADLRDETEDLDASTRLHRLFDELWQYRMESEPELATVLGERGPTYRWTDRSLEAIDRRKEDVAAALAELEAFDVADLDDTDRTSLRLATYDYAERAATGAFPGELLAVTTMDGPHVDIPQVLSLMPARQVGDLEDVVARLHGISVFVDQVIGLLEEGRRTGVTVPRVVAEQLPPAVHALVAAPPDASPLLAPFVNGPGAIDASDFDDLHAEALDAVTSAASAFGRFAAYLTDTYVPACRETTALSDLPDGAAWYAQLARAHTTTDLPPQEIHEMGLAEVARIRAAMVAAVEATGFSGTFEEFADHLKADDRFYFATPDELLTHYRDLAKQADAELPRLFGLLPRLPYGVKAVPEHEAPTAAAAFYLPGSIELGRSAWFCANTYDLRARPIYEMEATCLHEGVPGHHLQIALAAELEGLPPFRTKGWHTAYGEGWALYAESLGDDMGFYRDPYARFGQLSSEMLRAVRLVVDTGLHALGWSRERAIAYFAENSTTPAHEVVTEVDRYLSIPGQALAYKVGELTISRLRSEAAAALGDAFDVRAFHDLVLGAGSLPLDILGERVRGWVTDRSR